MQLWENVYLYFFLEDELWVKLADHNEAIKIKDTTLLCVINVSFESIISYTCLSPNISLVDMSNYKIVTVDGSLSKWAINSIKMMFLRKLSHSRVGRRF
jgi:hypothetical protein